ERGCRGWAPTFVPSVGRAPTPPTPPFAPGAFMWRKYGPLPVWGYAGAVLGLLLLYVWIRRGKAADQHATAVAGQDASTIAANTPKAPIFILPQTGLAGPAGPPGPAGPATTTVSDQPAGSGRGHPPGDGADPHTLGTPA